MKLWKAMEIFLNNPLLWSPRWPLNIFLEMFMFLKMPDSLKNINQKSTLNELFLILTHNSMYAMEMFFLNTNFDGNSN